MPRGLRALEWVGERDGFLRIVDQTRLPGEIRYLRLETVEEVCEAIVQLRIRGAPAIGVAAAFGVVLGNAPGALHNGSGCPCPFAASGRNAS
jgi:methylthioribose-1-phosphate isomerase